MRRCFAATFSLMIERFHCSTSSRCPSSRAGRFPPPPPTIEKPARVLPRIRLITAHSQGMPSVSVTESAGERRGGRCSVVQSEPTRRSGQQQTNGRTADYRSENVERVLVLPAVTLSQCCHLRTNRHPCVPSVPVASRWLPSSAATISGMRSCRAMASITSTSSPERSMHS